MATWSGPTWSNPTWAGPADTSDAVGEPVTPGSIRLVLATAGPIGLVDPGAYKPIMPGSIRMRLALPGPNPPIDPLDLRPIRPGSIRLELVSSGPQVLPPAVDDPAAPTPTPGYSVPAMTVAGSLAAKKTVAVSSGTFPTTGGLFVGLLVGVILIVGGLTFFPALALGPIAEHLAMQSGGLF